MANFGVLTRQFVRHRWTLNGQQFHHSKCSTMFTEPSKIQWTPTGFSYDGCRAKISGRIVSGDAPSSSWWKFREQSLSSTPCQVKLYEPSLATTGHKVSNIMINTNI